MPKATVIFPGLVAAALIRYDATERLDPLSPHGFVVSGMLFPNVGAKLRPMQIQAQRTPLLHKRPTRVNAMNINQTPTSNAVS